MHHVAQGTGIFEKQLRPFVSREGNANWIPCHCFVGAKDQVTVPFRRGFGSLRHIKTLD
jgi:hypothetical protein